MKMEPIVSSETSATKSQTPGNYPKRNKLHLQHGESLRTRLSNNDFQILFFLHHVLRVVKLRLGGWICRKCGRNK